MSLASDPVVPAKSTKNLWLIRHAESMANVGHKYPDMKGADFANTRLSADGRAQAEKVHGPIDLLIVSPLRRTLETYACSQLKVKRLFTSELVREYRAYGPSGDFELEAPHSESGDEFRRRIEQAVEMVRAQPETNIAILSHGVFLAEFARRLGKPLATSMANAQVIAIRNVSV
jgi:broad specificity phosphatase PhoE